jgi:2-phospho-L-lactate guanylyltransferase
MPVTFAVLPIKRFAAAKQRLTPPLEPEPREALAAAMCADAVYALTVVDGLDGIVIVSGEPALRILGERIHATLVDDPDESHSAAALRGIARAAELGAERVLCVPGDCPALDPIEVTGLLAGATAADAPSVVVVPDRHGTGTNALLLAPPDVMAPSFGPGSCERHLGLAREAGAAARIAELPSLALDVDTAGDLAALAAALEALPVRAAPRTRELLARTEADAA